MARPYPSTNRPAAPKAAEKEAQQDPDHPAITTARILRTPSPRNIRADNAAAQLNLVRHHPIPPDNRDFRTPFLFQTSSARPKARRVCRPGGLLACRPWAAGPRAERIEHRVEAFGGQVLRKLSSLIWTIGAVGAIAHAFDFSEGPKPVRRNVALLHPALLAGAAI